MTSQDAAELRGRIARNIETARMEHGFTQRQIAEQVGAAPDQVAKWCRGTHTPGFEYMTKLAAVLTDGDVAWFYRAHPGEDVAA